MPTRVVGGQPATVGRNLRRRGRGRSSAFPPSLRRAMYSKAPAGREGGRERGLVSWHYSRGTSSRVGRGPGARLVYKWDVSRAIETLSSACHVAIDGLKWLAPSKPSKSGWTVPSTKDLPNSWTVPSPKDLPNTSKRRGTAWVPTSPPLTDLRLDDTGSLGGLCEDSQTGGEAV